jgi:mono/diheme cytochrome c family protein
MKKIFVIGGFALSAFIISCTGAKGDYPGDTYAPDMWYSRAYESYGYNYTDRYYAELKQRGINYNAMPVTGTVARGEVYNTRMLTPDSAGILAAQSLRNPYDTIAVTPSLLAEAQRLYLINCGICHGSKLDGNGPLFNGGNGPYPAAPPALVSDAAKGWTDGYMYYVMTFGKGQMGSYASQLHPEQRWWVVKYIRSQQGPAQPASNTAAAADSTATAKK